MLLGYHQPPHPAILAWAFFGAVCDVADIGEAREVVCSQLEAQLGPLRRGFVQVDACCCNRHAIEAACAKFPAHPEFLDALESDSSKILVIGMAQCVHPVGDTKGHG